MSFWHILLRTKSWCGKVLFVSKNSKLFHINLRTDLSELRGKKMIRGKK